MKRSALVATVVLMLAGFWTTAASSESSNSPESIPHRRPVPAHCTIAAFRSFSRAVWAVERWRRGKPPEKVIAALERRISCAPPGHRLAMRKTWRRDKAAFYVERRRMLWLEEFKPFIYPSGRRWAVPYPIALCESGENYFVGPYGAYGLILEPPWLPPRRQDEIAHRLYVEQGEGPWAPFESGCMYR